MTDTPTTNENIVRKVPRSAPALSWMFLLLIIAYVVTITLFSFREGLTLGAKVVGGLLGIGFVFQVIFSGRRLFLPTTYRIWICWFLLAGFAIPLAISPEVATAKALTLLQVIPVAFLISNYLYWNKETRFYQLAIIATALVACIMVWVNPGPFTGVDGRVHGPLGNANSFGIMLVAALVFSLTGAAAARNILARAAWIGTAIPLFVMIIQTGSRQALIGAMLAAIVTFFAYLLRAGKASLTSLVIAVALAIPTIPVIMSYVSDSQFWFRTETALTSLASGDLSEADNSLVGRLWFYQRSLEIAIDKPLFGAGLDNFRMAKSKMGGKRMGTYSHSNYMEILATTGFVGFFLYFSIYWLWLKNLYRYRRLIFHPIYSGRYTCVLVMLTTFMILDLTTVSYYDKFQWLVFAWAIAELELLKRILAKASASPSTTAVEDEGEPKEKTGEKPQQNDYWRPGHTSI